jgi:hypothetical protein
VTNLHIQTYGSTDFRLDDFDVETLREFARWHTTLEKFDLTLFRLKTIGPDTFSHFRNLSTLRLANLGLDKIENGMFDGLPDLNELNLNGNKLEFLEPGVFGKLSQLTTLTLTRNPLSVDLHEDTFSGLENLRGLDVRLTPLAQVINQQSPIITKHMKKVQLGR